MSDVDEAAAALERGGVVAFPTETVWGIGARLDRPEAIRRIFTLKGREPDKPLQVLLPSPDDLHTIAHAGADAVELARRFMPGPLTLVLPAREELPDLGAEGTVGVRVPAHPQALELLARSGPLAATSANRAGEPTPPTLDGVREVFGDGLDAYLEGDPPEGTASTVVTLTGGLNVLREGVLTREELEAAVNGRLDPGW